MTPEGGLGRGGQVGWMPLGPARRENKEESGMGRKDDWAEMILGCAEKKKKVFRFWFKEWFSNLNFKYLQTKFELDF
jgi:hypothetical protein